MFQGGWSHKDSSKARFDVTWSHGLSSVQLIRRSLSILFIPDHVTLIHFNWRVHRQHQRHTSTSNVKTPSDWQNGWRWIGGSESSRVDANITFWSGFGDTIRFGDVIITRFGDVITRFGDINFAGATSWKHQWKTRHFSTPAIITGSLLSHLMISKKARN